MNLKYIRYNLEEIQEEVANLISKIEEGQLSHENFYSSMQHLIHHANIAWNARETTWEQIEIASDDDIAAWGKFPTDLTLI